LPELPRLQRSPELKISEGSIRAIFGNSANPGNVLHPIPKSADDSNGVPHTRQMTAEQSPQISGSVTSHAQLGQ
jgi:hypothetical protein